MLKKITIQELTPGMNVVNLNLPWLSNPFLYAEEGLIKSQEQIDDIIAKGFLEVYIDTAEDTANEGETPVEVQAALPSKRAYTHHDKIPPTTSIQEELPIARQLYDNSVRFAKTAMQKLSLGNELPMDEAEGLISNVMESVTRNYNALSGLIKLRTRDEYTYTHCINVAVLAIILARQMGLNQDETRKIGLAGLFHDVGKIHIPNKILNSPRNLTPEEFEIMKEHPMLGLKNLDKNKIYPEVVHGILEHHEKLNGSGYPQGLKGDEISLVGKLLSVVDVYDALTSRRVYKDPMLPHQALSLMYSMRGQEFDENILEHFIISQGIYPVGSVVELNTGWRGTVVQISTEHPLMPQVALLRSPSGQKNYSGEIVDLSKERSMKIVKVMGAVQAGVDPSMVLPGTAGSALNYVKG